jgi:hypothetical protein
MYIYWAYDFVINNDTSSTSWNTRDKFGKYIFKKKIYKRIFKNKRNLRKAINKKDRQKWIDTYYIFVIKKINFVKRVMIIGYAGIQIKQNAKESYK